MKEGSFQGHYTNHSLRVSSATRLFDAEVDKHLIMSRTGHSSTDGVHAYKRTSTKLKQLTPDVLNSGNAKPVAEPATEPEAREPNRHCDDDKEIKPNIQITGGNVTINFHS